MAKSPIQFNAEDYLHTPAILDWAEQIAIELSYTSDTPIDWQTTQPNKKKAIELLCTIGLLELRSDVSVKASDGIFYRYAYSKIHDNYRAVNQSIREEIAADAGVDVRDVPALTPRSMKQLMNVNHIQQCKGLNLIGKIVAELESTRRDEIDGMVLGPCFGVWYAVRDLDASPDELHTTGSDRLVTGVESGAHVETATKSKRQQEPIEWLAKAMLIVKDHPEWSDAKIAGHVGRHKGTVSRNAFYQAAAKRARSTSHGIPKGKITYNRKTETSNIEAFAAEHDSY